MDNSISNGQCVYPDLRQLDIRRTLIAPSLLAADFARIGQEVAAVEEAGAEALHLDVMDGHFVPNISFGADIVKAARPYSKALFDTHLMISEPLRYAPNFIKAGSQHITFHVESDDDPAAVIRAIHDGGCTAGISVKPKTPASAVFPYLESVELVLVMTVEPGFGGQSFMADQLPKIAEIRREIDSRGLKVHLEVDGGIAAATAPLVREAGANMLVAGSSVFRAKDGYKAAVQCLR